MKPNSATLNSQHNEEEPNAIQDWNSIYNQQIDGSLSNSLHDICQCCGKQNCENLDYFNQLIKKLESDTRLAAEIGQGLLQKHELYVNESNQERAILEKQLDEYQEKINELEQSLDDLENDKSKVIKEKNKWHWEYQKRQKILDETVSDLESANDKCNQLTKELQLKSNELEKLRLFKFMVRHSESREETLTSKLEDTNQELAICRKNELLLESKVKKLKTNYENLYNSHEKLLREFESLHATNRNNSSKLQLNTEYDTIKNTNNTNDLIDLIKELSLANTKLKLDLMNCKDQLSESKGEVIALTQKMDDLTESSSNKITRLKDDLNPLRRAKSVKESIKPDTSKKSSKTLQCPPIPTISTSMPTSTIPENQPILHHHHHYDEKQPIDNKDDQILVISPSTPTDNTSMSPFIMLQEHISNVLERLKSSDIRALNRRLKRAFDITELSNMSNSIIENILMDVETLESRFLWVKNSTSNHDGFFPILDLLKQLLKDVGVLRTTMNDLQVEYVKKIKESETRVEEEIIRKREIKRQQTAANLQSMTTSKSLAWISNIFYKNSIDDTTSTITSISENQPHYDKVSTLSKTTTDSSIQSPDDDEHHHTIKNNRNNTFPSRQDNIKRRQIPYFPQMTTSSSTGTSRSTPSIAIRNKRSVHRINIDYEGIGPAAIRPIPSDRDHVVSNFSSSWLGGK